MRLGVPLSLSEGAAEFRDCGRMYDNILWRQSPSKPMVAGSRGTSPWMEVSELDD
jgi:hypothetical protein